MSHGAGASGASRSSRSSTAGRAAARFRSAHRAEPDGVWVAPGRVNLIGEHTDYNDGFALPFAVPRHVACAAAARTDRRMVVRSAWSPVEPAEPVELAVDELRPGAVPGWAGYPAGVAWALAERGCAVGGVDLVLDGDLPVGAGLSSSAALSCVVAMAMAELYRLDLDRTELAMVAATAESEFVGVPTGVLDQLAVLLGVAGHALFVDARTLAARPVPFAPRGAGLALLVVDTGVRRELAASGYAERRRACERAAHALGVPALRDARPEQATELTDPRLRRAATHVTSENARVIEVVTRLRAGADPRPVGPLLTASHRSLRDDFAVSCAELDLAVEVALANGAHGARMTGGGFGGCAIALVDAGAADALSAALTGGFAAAGFAAPAVFPAEPAAGASRER